MCIGPATLETLEDLPPEREDMMTVVTGVNIAHMIPSTAGEEGRASQEMEHWTITPVRWPKEARSPSFPPNPGLEAWRWMEDAEGETRDDRAQAEPGTCCVAGHCVRLVEV